jgi:hypothetical protein
MWIIIFSVGRIVSASHYVDWQFLVQVDESIARLMHEASPDCDEFGAASALWRRPAGAYNASLKWPIQSSRARYPFRSHLFDNSINRPEVSVAHEGDCEYQERSL